MNKKLMIMGHGDHGKDTVAEMLRPHGYEFMGSSWCIAQLIYPVMLAADDKPDYASVEDCYNDRANHRKYWYEWIKWYNTPHPARLAKQIYETSDVYVGVRSEREFIMAQKLQLFDLAIWVDASERVPPELKESCTVEAHMADIIIQNNGTEEELRDKVNRLGRALNA